MSVAAIGYHLFFTITPKTTPHKYMETAILLPNCLYTVLYLYGATVTFFTLLFEAIATQCISKQLQVPKNTTGDSESTGLKIIARN